MKVKILLILFTLIFSTSAFAQKQHDENKRKEMMEIKLKFLAEEIGLKDDQKKLFDELYTRMESERREVFKKMKAAQKLIKDNKKASEADYEKANNDINNGKKQMAQIEAKYEAQFAKFLTKKQLFKLKEAETKFMETMRSCRDKKRNQQNK